MESRDRGEAHLDIALLVCVCERQDVEGFGTKRSARLSDIADITLQEL